MDILQNFLLAFIFSFLGSIPPGTLNLTVLQLGLEKKTTIALRFAIAAALIEYPYAWLAITFEKHIASSPVIVDNFKIGSAVVMILLGGLNIWSAKRPTVFTEKFHESGFRRGVILSILNPLALPFWIAITAYLNVQGWISLQSNAHLHLYLLGISLGAFALLMMVTYLAKQLVSLVKSDSMIKLIPGFVLLGLGFYALIGYLLS